MGGLSVLFEGAGPRVALPAGKLFESGGVILSDRKALRGKLGRCGDVVPFGKAQVVLRSTTRIDGGVKPGLSAQTAQERAPAFTVHSVFYSFDGRAKLAFL